MNLTNSCYLIFVSLSSVIFLHVRNIDQRFLLGNRMIVNLYYNVKGFENWGLFSFSSSKW